jgi:hypothetical protein
LLIARTLLQILHASQDRATQPRPQQSVKFRRVALQGIRGTRRRLNARLKVVKVGVDAGHPISKVHAMSPEYTIRLLPVSLNATDRIICGAISAVIRVAHEFLSAWCRAEETPQVCCNSSTSRALLKEARHQEKVGVRASYGFSLRRRVSGSACP